MSVIGILDFFKGKDINEGVEKYRSTKGAMLIDVREPMEFKDRKIDGAVNIPLGKISSIRNSVKDLNRPLFIYCRSGARARRAVSMLKKMGYTSVENIGGILDYKNR